MHHGDMPNAISLHPGETKEVVWQFDNAWQIEGLQRSRALPGGNAQRSIHREIGWLVYVFRRASYARK